jgi:hypothetical protein
MAACEAAGEAARMALGVTLAAPGSIAVGAAHAASLDASPSASLAPHTAAMLSFARAPVLLLSISPSADSDTSSLVPLPAAPALADRRSSCCARARQSGERRVGARAAGMWWAGVWWAGMWWAGVWWAGVWWAAHGGWLEGGELPRVRTRGEPNARLQLGVVRGEPEDGAP